MLGKIWHTRGGGLYALGYIVIFFYLEAKYFVTDLAAAEGVVDFIAGELMERILRFAGESLGNFITALIWPILVLDWLGGWGIVLLVAGFTLFDGVVKERLGAWLAPEDNDQGER